MSIPQGNQNQFFGQKVSKPGINVNNASDNQLIYKNDYSTQTFYTSTGTLNLGTIGANALGMSLLDVNNNPLFALNGQTWSWYDNNKVNIMQLGLLPDGTYGLVVAKPGIRVASLYS